MRLVFKLFKWSFAVSVMAAVMSCATADVRSRPGTKTTVIVLRHADRDENADDLNGRGVERAKALVDAVRPLRVTAIYSPDVPRNLNTVRPLANDAGIEITRTPAVSFFSASAIVNEILERHAGGVVVYVGNVTGNLQRIYGLLGGTGMGPVYYGDLHVLTLSDNGPVTVVKKTFGSPVRE